MDDSCAVCAETLLWTAYGQCGHREVCSTCVARLRFICDDQNCCICKSSLNIIFVTKALGDYTSVISDFSVFPSEPKEGKVGSYWYHEGTHAFFDDPDHYKMVKAMCKLSCIICDNIHEQGNGNIRRKGIFKNIDQLNGHLSSRHKLIMCYLCLEGRKIFICEQKLYTEEQLNQHINTGNSEVDGSEAERGGFMGHPMCEFCRYPFYGENELYTHMSTEHYTCHICQRQHPRHFEYYRNYDELEIHFRSDHMLCEDEGCLAKKFIVFATESEMKRHNTMEHGGRMSRSKRNAVLKIPTSFRYERNTEQDRHRRGRSSHSDNFDVEISRAVQASLETTNCHMHNASSSGFEVLSNIGAAAENDSKFKPLELLSSREFEPSSSHHHQQGQTSRNTPLEELSFPPLPVSTRNKQQNLRSKGKWSGKNTMAARLRRQNNVEVLHSAQTRTSVDLHPVASSSSSSKSRLTSTSGHKYSPATSGSSLCKPSAESILVRRDNSTSGSRALTAYESVSASSGRSSSTISGTKKVIHSDSEPNIAEKGLYSSGADFPPVSVIKTKQSTTSNQLLVKAEETKAANKSLVERIRAGSLFDEDRYTVFKIISGEYRRNLIDTGEYVAYVHQFGLSHLLSELAKLCPDAQKQKELFEASKISLASRSSSEISADMISSPLKEHKTSKKGKEKLLGVETNTKPGMANNFISGARVLHSGHRPPEEHIEILEKDGYRSMKGKSKVSVADELTNPGSSIKIPVENTLPNDCTSRSSSSKKNGEGNKLRKKTSKFHRVRLGEDSPAALLGLTHSESTPDLSQQKPSQSNGPSRKLAVGGVWHNGGGKKLVAILK